MIHFLSALFFPPLFYSEMVFFDNKTSGQKIPHLKKRVNLGAPDQEPFLTWLALITSCCRGNEGKKTDSTSRDPFFLIPEPNP
jgi:hypothetical protein